MGGGGDSSRSPSPLTTETGNTGEAHNITPTDSFVVVSMTSSAHDPSPSVSEEASHDAQTTALLEAMAEALESESGSHRTQVPPETGTSHSSTSEEIVVVSEHAPSPAPHPHIVAELAELPEPLNMPPATPSSLGSPQPPLIQAETLETLVVAPAVDPADIKLEDSSAASPVSQTSTESVEVSAQESVSGTQDQPSEQVVQAPASPAPPAHESAPATANPARPQHHVESEYAVRRVRWQNSDVSIICQNSNGPCPLLALANVLLLRRSIRLHPDVREVSFNYLIQIISDLLLDSASTIKGAERDVVEANIAAAIEVFPELQRGLDVNLRFSSPSAFEFTRELSVFDVFQIPLLHGWLVDPQNHEAHAALANLSYNQAIELATTGGDAGREPDIAHRALLAQEFLNESPSQLTYHGLAELHREMREGALAVLFRNNHFHVLHKHRNELYCLVTDAGFAQTRVVWELLQNVENDSELVDANFHVVREASFTAPAPVPGAEPSGTLSVDQQLALQLQREEEAAMAAAIEASNREFQQQQQQQQHHHHHQPPAPHRPPENAPQQPFDGAPQRQVTDEELARQLQLEEEQAANQAARAQHRPPPQQAGMTEEQRLAMEMEKHRRAQANLRTPNHAILDAEMARRLQQEEEMNLRRQQQQQQQQHHMQQQAEQARPRKNSASGCRLM